MYILYAYEKQNAADTLLSKTQRKRDFRKNDKEISYAYV